MSGEEGDQIDTYKMAMPIAFGPLVGFALGIALDNIGIGLSIGMGLGTVVGIAWSQT